MSFMREFLEQPLQGEGEKASLAMRTKVRRRSQNKSHLRGATRAELRRKKRGRAFLQSY